MTYPIRSVPDGDVAWGPDIRALIAGVNDHQVRLTAVEAVGPAADVSRSVGWQMLGEYFHDGGSAATAEANAGLVGAAVFKAVLTTAESAYVVQRHSPFITMTLFADRITAGALANYPQTTDTAAATTFRTLVDSYGYDNIYVFCMPEFDNDPGNAGWAANRFQEAGATDATRYDLPTGLTRDKAYRQFLHFYLSEHHDSITNHHRMGAILGVPSRQRGYQVMANLSNGGSAAYGYEMGMDLCTVQVQNDDISGIIGKIALTRGAASQYGKRWGIDFSWWRSYNPSGAGATAYTAGTLTAGWTPATTRKHYYLAWASGAHLLVNEAIDFSAGPASGQTWNPSGLEAQAFSDLSLVRHAAVQRGIPAVPVAIIKDHNSFWEPKFGQFNQGRAVWYSTFTANGGENLLYNLWDYLFPNASTWGSSTTSAEPMGGGRFGEQFDVLTDKASAVTLAKYRVAMLSTAAAVDSSVNLDTLYRFVSGGGVLILTASQLSGTSHQSLTGITVTGTTTSASGPTITWIPDSTTNTETGTVSYSTVTLGTATTYARLGASTPFITKNVVGSGAVYTLLGAWGSNTANTVLLNSTTKLISEQLTLVTKATFTGANHTDYDYGITYSANRIVVTMVNTSATTTLTGTLTFQVVPGGYTLQNWVDDTNVTNSLVGGKPTVSVSLTAGTCRVYALTY